MTCPDAIGSAFYNFAISIVNVRLLNHICKYVLYALSYLDSSPFTNLSTGAQTNPQWHKQMHHTMFSEWRYLMVRKPWLPRGQVWRAWPATRSDPDAHSTPLAHQTPQAHLQNQKSSQRRIASLEFPKPNHENTAPCSGKSRKVLMVMPLTNSRRSSVMP